MSVITNIKKSLKLRIQSLSSVQAVYGHEELAPNGWPAVWVLPANLDGEFTSTVENRRTYGFNITVLFPLGEDFSEDGENREEYAQDRVAEVMEDIINNADADYELTSDANVLYTEASDAEWGTIDYQGGQAKAVQITLLVVLDYNVTS